MEVSFEAYLNHLGQLGKILEDLTALTKEQTAAVAKGDLNGVDSVLRREQALSMSLRGSEQKREKFMQGLGLKGTSLSDLPDRVPEALRPQARETVDALRRRYQVYQGCAEAARTTLECGIHLIEKHMQDVPGAQTPAPGGSVADIRA